MYEDYVLKHYSEPFHKGPPKFRRLFARTFIENEVGSNCGDKVTLTVRVLPNGCSVDIWWEGEGCCFSQAAASMLAEHFQGKTLEDVRQFTQDDMLKLFKVDVPTGRLGCVLVSYNALKRIPEKLS